MTTLPHQHPALFLDRDGVIIENRADYVRRWSDVAIYAQALEALVRARDWPCKIVIVTNQSAIGRGLLAPDQAQAINRRLVAMITAAGGRIDGVFMCPHAPHAGCNCRKPAPGLLLQAAQALHIDLSRSALIGDALSDLAAAHAAHLPQAALVRTGRGATQLQLPARATLPPFPIFTTLAHALHHLTCTTTTLSWRHHSQPSTQHLTRDT